MLRFYYCVFDYTELSEYLGVRSTACLNITHIICIIYGAIKYFYYTGTSIGMWYSTNLTIRSGDHQFGRIC